MKAASRSKALLVASLVLNVALILTLVTPSLAMRLLPEANLDIAEYNSAHYRLCEENYNLHTKDMTNDQKKKFTALTCGRDYKTGEELDFQPVIDQIQD